jgi:GTPase Era involved in 16S rRNA processing
MPNLVVAVLGHRNTGKSTTWNTLFGATVKTGKHERRL